MSYSKKSCPQCGKEHENPKFCSRSCSAVYTNARRSAETYRRGEGRCKDCGTTISKRRARCRSCMGEWQHKRAVYDKLTLGEAVERYSHLHKNSAFALVRTRARSLMKHHNCCQWCGYDKHVEVAHRKAISEFPPETLLSEINKLDNLLALCPNCHWEHDKLDRRE